MMKVKFLTIVALAAVLFLSACGKSDADLQKAATDKLAAENIMGVTVAVNDGNATLTGEVADVTVVSRAETSVKMVEGMKAVTNNLKTKPLPTPVPAAVDPMLKGKLDEALRKAGCTGVTIEAMGGTVTATGTVPGAKYVQCIQIINESGLGKLENKIVKGN